jgi:Fungal protein kinase
MNLIFILPLLMPETQIFVLKRYWRPYRNPSSQANIPSEADRYHLFDSADERLYSYEDITIDGNVDSTLEWIRKGLSSVARPDIPKIGLKIGSKRVRNENHEDAEPFLHVKVADLGYSPHFITAADPGGLVSRAHTQLIMPYSGWPIRHFKSLLELVQVFLAAVRGSLR